MSKKPTNSNQKRIEFLTPVKKTLYERAGGRCSFPRCKNPTMGPFRSNQKAINMGVACHIYSAAVDGPRGQGEKDKSFIGSAENGIWCCKYHGDLIDKGTGADFPADNLFAWKALAEARTRKQMDDIPSPLGWIESIEYIEFLGIRRLPKIQLSRQTLVTGRNSGGKTSLFEAAASLSDSRYAERFSRGFVTDASGNRTHPKFVSKITYSTVDTLSKELFVEVCGDSLIRRDNNSSFLFPPGDIEVIYCSEKDLRRLPGEDDVDFLMRVIGVDRCTLLALIKIGTNTVIHCDVAIEVAQEQDDEGENIGKVVKPDGELYLELMIRIRGHKFPVPLSNLSTSEIGKFILDLSITKAREVCKQKLTLFIIDGLIYNFDFDNFETLLNALSQCDFQTIVVIPPNRDSEFLTLEKEKTVLAPVECAKTWKLAIVGD